MFFKERTLKANKMLRNLVISMGFLSLINCSDRQKDMAKDEKLFTKVSVERSGIDFANNLIENDSVNYFKYIQIYMGGGVAIGDINNDGLQDLYFTGNMVENKLYLNKGDFKFEDITKQAGVGADNRWVTGVTMGDANQDGWLDIYVSVSGIWDTTKNLLYINDANENGNPTFTESGERFGVADIGHGTQAVFFDYDRDGDQDLYVLNYPVNTAGQNMQKFKEYQKNNVPYRDSDRLYQNTGEGFIDVTKEAKLSKYGLSLGVSVGDYNQDGWQDLYVSNDFVTPDYFLINNKDGTFRDYNLELTKHTAYFGMGTDAADFNNDGYLDFFQADMLPDDNRRSKANMDSMDPDRFHLIVENDMHHQYSANMLQLNMGLNEKGLPMFSDVARLSNVHSTDWSWGPLFADFDFDGHKDLMVTNGIRYEINNKDFFINLEESDLDNADWLSLNAQMPSEKIPNLIYKNSGNLEFEEVTEKWGFYEKGFSNGSAYADLDNDGDLDLVINNLNEEASVFKNNAVENGLGNFIKVKFKGPAKNPFGIGAKVWVSTKENEQYQELTLTRGFQSSVPAELVFGLGDNDRVHRVVVEWPTGSTSILQDVEINTTMVVDHAGSQETPATVKEASSLFKDITDDAGLVFKHEENSFDDYRYQVLLPHNISEYGPALAVGDINNDGLDDFYVGGAYGSTGSLFVQEGNGKFKEIKEGPWIESKFQEDTSAIFVDTNGDGLQDLYVVSGGNEYPVGHQAYQDRLYINLGAGSFARAKSALPIATESGGYVTAADYDNDGDEDLFVAGRIVPRNYPKAPRSVILRNDSQGNMVKFTDVTSNIAPILDSLGMVTKAKWIDLDKDNALDLMLIGEWMPITYLKNNNGKFTDRTEQAQLSNTQGWWYGMEDSDFDGDGDTDFIFGNLGYNYKYKAKKGEPFTLYTYDYDGNNNEDLVLSYYQDGEQYPVRGRECSSQQIPAIKKKFKDYNSFAEANLAQIYSKEHLEKSTKFSVEDFGSVYVENLGDGTFQLKRLELFAQLSSLNDFATGDFNNDGNLDVLGAGNLYGSEVETPRNDAGYGLVLIGNGKGEFKALKPYETGVHISGEVKSIHKIRLAGGKEGFLIAKNNDFLQLIAKS
ncbi:VCBS repeat-containing protein [Maribacter sp. 2307ULW6-5]|uniref:VCBS repeat-containing protein n=1 Tax=Maribacter sp. 2307ULW6-5 TaxID=3386275 RepID=UPI0039BD2B6F